MYNKFFLSLCILNCIVLNSFALPEINLIEGTWILSSVQAKGTITVGGLQTAVGNNSSENDIDETQVISLKEDVENNLRVGHCRFVFKGTQYEFSRKGETLSHKGTWAIKENDTLLLTRAHIKEPLANKILRLNQQVLELGITYSGKQVTLIFTKKP